MSSSVSPAGASAPTLHLPTKLGFTESMLSRITAHATMAPDRAAVVDGSSQITFAELEFRSNQLAAYLGEQELPADSCVALLFDRCADFIIAALAVLKSGASYLPLDSSIPADRLSFILNDSAAPILLTHRGKTEASVNRASRVIDLDAMDLTGYPTSSTNFEPPLDSLAYVIYTSGSTGRPKGVEITHGNLRNLIEWHQEAFDVTANDRASQVAGLGFDAAVWEIWPHLTAGATLHIADEITRRSPQALRDWIVQNKISISFVPTVLAEQLIHSDWPANASLRYLLTGADTLHRRPSANLPFKLINNYGPTECTVVATSGLVDPTAEGAPSIGKPITNTSAHIVNESLQAVAPGEIGELCLAGAHVGRGYRNNPALTAEKFVDYTPTNAKNVRIYRTGDRARMLENGEIAFIGRVDDQVKIRGYRVELGEIIAWLDKVPGVEASAVLARESDAGAELVAYVVLHNGANLTAADLREHLSGRLPDYMLPARYVAMQSLPITPNGKLDKAALPVPSPANLLPSGSSAAVISTNNYEHRIGEMVASLLGQPSVARDDNFFMLGGHSMLGVQLVARIRDTFGVKLTLRQLFTAPTVAALSAEVAKLAAK